MIEILIQYVSIWLPSLVAILGVVASVLVAIGKTKVAINEFKKSDELAELTAEVKRLASENKELRHTENLLLDELTKIKNYVETKRK